MVIAKLLKLAYDLDRKGLTNEAHEIEEAIKTLAKRVGITSDDSIALADFFDEIGSYAMADMFDRMTRISVARERINNSKATIEDLKKIADEFYSNGRFEMANFIYNEIKTKENK